MAWDFSTDPEFQTKLDWVERFCQDKVEPLDYVFPHAVRWPDPVVKAYVRELQQEVKDQGLWAIFLDRELGGPGFGQLRLALLNEVIGRYPGAPAMFGAAAPDTGNMEILAAYGTEEQKKRWLEPLLNQDMFSAYSMTEPQGGSDPDLFKTHAERDGDEWVINGEKWFTSAGRVADLLFVMCTNGVFVVPRRTPASRSCRSRGTTITSSTATFGCPWTICSARRTAPRWSPSVDSAAAAFTMPCEPSPSATSPST
jgi:acyl-CoA dehydrogenase